MRHRVWYLYRCYDEQSNLLYVGAGKVERLLLAHRETYWFSKVVKITIERFSERWEVLQAERKAIATEHPKINKQHNKYPGPNLDLETICDGRIEKTA
jgi:hypothetical protein